MAESKTRTFTVITEKRDPTVTVNGEPLVVSTRTVTVEATSDSDAKKKVEKDLSEGESVIATSAVD